jgi:predicted amidohydrolase
MNRRSFLTALGTAPAMTGFARPATSNQSPRKVIVGTVMQAYWEQHPGLRKRLAQLTTNVDDLQAESQRKYGRGLDLAILPEVAVTGETGRDVAATAVALAGELEQAFSSKARAHNCYLVAPTYLAEREPQKGFSNAAILFGRKGDVRGIYRKVHLVVSDDGQRFEGGCTPGQDVPVFDCDFGKLGIQICFDMEFDYGWNELARKGAELVAWPTQSPQTSHPAFRAMQNRCYIVSSTWRNNASIFEPTGKITAQLRPPGHILVQELDLSYAILPWHSKLKNGETLRKTYGGKVGFRYYEDEDCGIFWSNDSQLSIGEMARTVGVPEAEPMFERVRGIYRSARVPGYS